MELIEQSTTFSVFLIDSFEIHCFVSVLLKKLTLTCSEVIETVVHNASRGNTQSRESPLCTFCDMIVFWIQVQLKQKNAKEKILKHVDEVVVVL